MARNEITGRLRDRFIQGAVLLYLIDPVRAAPTAYGLDQDASLRDPCREVFLKRKFLESFALICAIRKDPKSVSAACLEEGQPGGTIVRIASNAGVAADTITSLQRLVDMISSKPIRELPSGDLETIILSEIVQLDIVKIRDYMKLLKTSRNVFDVKVHEVRSRLVNVAPEMISPSVQEFLTWFEQLLSIEELSDELMPTILQGYIMWAQKAKKAYYKHLSLAFSSTTGSLPRWVRTVFKLGRYGIAARSIAQTLIMFPALFDSMVIESVSAPPIVPYALLEGERPLERVLRRIPEIKVEDTTPRLSSIWGTDDPETAFRNSCPRVLSTHAEVQLISFYDHNPIRRPHLRFMGVSKKSCYLCWRFLQNHPSGFYVSSCHQKLYPSWIPAPSTDLKVYKKYKMIILEMSEMMERVAREELSARLGLKRLMPADSTAGVSLSGLTELGKVKIADFVGRVGAVDPQHVEAPVNHERPSSDPRGSNASNMACARAWHYPGKGEYANSFSSMVFRFKDQRDEEKQDIIMIDSILDPETQIPSWLRLVDLLNSEDSFGLVFRNSDFLLLNNNIRIRNQRQLLACLQWLLNEGCWNAEARVCS